MALGRGSRTRGVKKSHLKKKVKRQGGSSLYGIKQGVGAVTKYPFPKKKKSAKNGNGRRCASWRQGLNALSPTHLPLPRAVGSYSVIRTTDTINSANRGMLFGVFKGPRTEFTDTVWLNTCGVLVPGGTGLTDAINASGNAYFVESTAISAASLAGARMVPAAITLQVMNGEALQSSSGIVYIGRSKTVLDLMGDTRSWETVFKELISYSAPRLCSAGKLALRGVQVNAIPNNMSVLSDFVPRGIANNAYQTWNEGDYSVDFEGFAPIFVYNPEGVALNFLLTIEWRMRFDPLNPAYAGHTLYRPSSEQTWSNAIADAESIGHGVVDIADVTADVGMGLGGAAAAFG